MPSHSTIIVRANKRVNNALELNKVVSSVDCFHFSNSYNLDGLSQRPGQPVRQSATQQHALTDWLAAARSVDHGEMMIGGAPSAAGSRHPSLTCLVLASRATNTFLSRRLSQ